MNSEGVAGMWQACSHSGNIWQMIGPPAGERGFALALIVSIALHVALLTALLSFASGSVPGRLPSLGEAPITAFLVSGSQAAAGRTAALPVRKRLTEKRAAPAAAPPRGIPTDIAPVEPAKGNPPAEIRPSAEHPGIEDDAGALPAPVSQTPPVIAPESGRPSGSAGTGSRTTRPGGTEVSGGTGATPSASRRDGTGGSGAGSSATRQGGGETSGGTGTAPSASRQEGTGDTPRQRSGVSPPKDVDAVPRYGDNARPVYPPLARLRGYEGVVLLVVDVLADGRVGQVEIKRSAGHGILDRAALEAVRTWRFEPGRREGRAVTMSVEVPVRFVLNGDAPG